MLTRQLKDEAQQILRTLTAALQFDKETKETIKLKTIAINDLISSFKSNPQTQRDLLVQISNQICPRMIAFQKLSEELESIEEKMKFDKEEGIFLSQKANKIKIQAVRQIQQHQLKIQEIKQTISRIQSAVKDSIQEQNLKRINIQKDMEKSLTEIQDKILSFSKQAEEKQKSSQHLKIKKKEIQQKLGRLELDFKQKAEQKDEQVKKEKEELMAKLQTLQGEVSQVNELNKEYSTKEKANFDKKLSLYLKTKKFPDYFNSFQNSAKTIDQCKQELMKGVQRMNEAKEAIERYEKQEKDLGTIFLTQLKKKNEKETKIQNIKKEKEQVRDRIIALQNKIKDLKNKPNETNDT